MQLEQSGRLRIVIENHLFAVAYTGVTNLYKIVLSSLGNCYRDKAPHSAPSVLAQQFFAANFPIIKPTISASFVFSQRSLLQYVSILLVNVLMRSSPASALPTK